MESTATNSFRQQIQQLKQLPPLPVIAEKILGLTNDDGDIRLLAATIEQEPGLSARLLGLANSAYFGWPGGVHSIYDAIYKVLGLKTVKSLALGLTLGEALQVKACPRFRLEQYWFTAISTAIMAQSLLSHLAPTARIETENIHVNGLLHNLGLPVLVHLFPREMDRVFARLEEDGGGSLSDCTRELLGIDPCEAGGWLARKWHLPEDVVCVMDHHKDSAYRKEHWPVVLLVGLCSRMAAHIYSGTPSEPDGATLSTLGIPWLLVEKSWQQLGEQRDEIIAMTEVLGEGGRDD